jgi:FO synthase
VHHGSPDKHPAARLATIREAGRQRVPFTSGILIGIGETRAERTDSLLALAALHREHGHLQEIIIQNFRAKPGTKRAGAPEPDIEELLWTVALARLIFGPTVAVQAPPNLSPEVFPRLIAAGLNDWGGISPVTPDHVNPEAPWPAIDALAQATAAEGKILVPRLALYPSYALDAERWTDRAVAPRVRAMIDAEGLAREDGWSPGIAVHPPPSTPSLAGVGQEVPRLADRAMRGERLTEANIVRLFAARDADFDHVCRAADELRRDVSGDVVRYVVNRNINYTNICTYRCGFCAFSKGRTHENLRGTPYDLDHDEVIRRVEEAWARGATEVCMQGGIHPDYTGATYLSLCRAVKEIAPAIHIHAFSPLEISQGASTLGISIREFLIHLREAGLGTLPGTAAEILDDPVRAVICPDKLSTAEWLDVIETAHEVGLRTTATIMYGHVERPLSWARHLLALRDLQARTGGLTEFVPLPLVHMEAPLFLKGLARKGPTWREAVLMHAVARLALHPLIPNIQTSWVKMGRVGAQVCLQAGANDLGGTLMNESISRAAGTAHGQELPPEDMEALIRAIGRRPEQRDTLYRPVIEDRQIAARHAAPLAPIVLTPPRRRATQYVE